MRDEALQLVGPGIQSDESPGHGNPGHRKPGHRKPGHETRENLGSVVDPTFRLRGVEKAYRHFRLAPLDLELESGTILGLIGPNGAGKSTLLRILMGLIRPDAGEVEVLGRRLPEFGREVKGEIGFVSEDMRLYGGETLRWHIDWIRTVIPRWDESYARKLVERFGLVLDQKIKGLSHGQRVKATLLLALARRPRLLVLDEPTTGLDPIVRREVLDELLQVLRDESRSVVFSSHNTGDVERISDYIAFIDSGQLLESDEKESLLDRWRRIRVRVGSRQPVFENDRVTLIEEDGGLVRLTTGSFHPDYAGELADCGHEVLEVDRMSLEEIFLSRVEMNRQGA